MPDADSPAPVACTRCRDEVDELHPPGVVLPWTGDVCEPCLLDLLDVSRGMPPRSGRDLPTEQAPEVTA